MSIFQISVVLVLIVTIGLNLLFILETGRRLQNQQEQFDMQHQRGHGPTGNENGQILAKYVICMVSEKF